MCGGCTLSKLPCSWLHARCLHQLITVSTTRRKPPLPQPSPATRQAAYSTPTAGGLSPAVPGKNRLPAFSGPRATLHLYRSILSFSDAGAFVTHTHTQVKHIKPGDRVVAAFDIACGSCRSCSREAFSSCDVTNPSKDQEMLYGARCVMPYILRVPYSHSPWGSSGHSARCSCSFASVTLCWQLGTTL